jgi:hypothetical protein
LKAVVSTADRIKLYPKLDITTTPSGNAVGGDGTLDRSADSGMQTETIKIDSMGKRGKSVPEFPSQNA